MAYDSNNAHQRPSCRSEKTTPALLASDFGGRVRHHCLAALDDAQSNSVIPVAHRKATQRRARNKRVNGNGLVGNHAASQGVTGPSVDGLLLHSAMAVRLADELHHAAAEGTSAKQHKRRIALLDARASRQQLDLAHELRATLERVTLLHQHRATVNAVKGNG